MGMTTGDDPRLVHQNRRRLHELMDLELKFAVHQVHGDTVLVIKDFMDLMAVERADPPIQADALVTNLPDLPLVLYTADCVPVYLYDPLKNVIALVHGGWRGTVKKIVARTISAMEEAYGTNPASLQVALGPSIGPCCFEVGEEVWEEFRTAFHFWPNFVVRTPNKFFVDLWTCTTMQLFMAGVREENVVNSQVCTSCNNDFYYSYRRDSGDTGRMAAIISLRP